MSIESAAGKMPMDSPSAIVASVEPLPTIQLFFLRRMIFIVDREREARQSLNSNDWPMRALSKALYSTYQDCADLGMSGLADILLRRNLPAGKS